MPLDSLFKKTLPETELARVTLQLQELSTRVAELKGQQSDLTDRKDLLSQIEKLMKEKVELEIKLEQGQPAPRICDKCGPVQIETYTYKKCGHVYSHMKEVPVPAECQTCRDRSEMERLKKAQEDLALTQRAERIKAENKDLRVWLNREVAKPIALIREPAA